MSIPYTIADTPEIEWWKLAATVVLALIAAFIAVRQTMIARQKLRLDLFEKREPIFELAWKLCSAYLGTAQRAQQDRDVARAEVQNVCPRAGFLFDAGIEAYLRELILRAAEMDSWREAAASSGDAASGIEGRRIIHEGLKFFVHEGGEGCKARFAPYLEFSLWR